MTHTELTAMAFLFGVLDNHTDTMDVYLPNTDDMWQLVLQMEAWNLRMTVAEYLALPDDHPEKKERPVSDTITYHSCHLLPFLYEKVKAAVGNKPEEEYPWHHYL